METFSALLAICAGNSPVTGEFPAQRPVTRSLDVFFDLCLNKRLSKQSWGWLFDVALMLDADWDISLTSACYPNRSRPSDFGIKDRREICRTFWMIISYRKSNSKSLVAKLNNETCLNLCCQHHACSWHIISMCLQIWEDFGARNRYLRQG